MQKYPIGQYAQRAIDAAGIVLLVTVALLVVGFVLGAVSPYGSGEGTR